MLPDDVVLVTRFDTESAAYRLPVRARVFTAHAFEVLGYRRCNHRVRGVCAKRAFVRQCARARGVLSTDA